MEKSGKNAEGDSWWETWQEVLHQDEWRSDLMDFFFYKIFSDCTFEGSFLQMWASYEFTISKCV